jgi:hypothetical protein
METTGPDGTDFSNTISSFIFEQNVKQDHLSEYRNDSGATLDGF